MDQGNDSTYRYCTIAVDVGHDGGAGGGGGAGGRRVVDGVREWLLPRRLQGGLIMHVWVLERPDPVSHRLSCPLCVRLGRFGSSTKL